MLIIIYCGIIEKKRCASGIQGNNQLIVYTIPRSLVWENNLLFVSRSVSEKKRRKKGR